MDDGYDAGSARPMRWRPEEDEGRLQGVALCCRERWRRRQRPTACFTVGDGAARWTSATKRNGVGRSEQPVRQTARIAAWSSAGYTGGQVGGRVGIVRRCTRAST